MTPTELGIKFLNENPDHHFQYHRDGEQPPQSDNFIFVFGSNTMGIHGKGAAQAARELYDASPGRGVGRTGMAYAIPTKKEGFKVRTLAEIEIDVLDFIEYARANGRLNFYVTRIGCGLAGYNDSQIAPMFVDAPRNCIFALEWAPYLEV